MNSGFMASKRCPFCGGEVKVTHGLMNLPIWLFKCKNKDCGAVISFDCDRANNDPNEAFELWNRRVT